LSRNGSSAERTPSPESGSIFILTGVVHSGKTTFLKKIIAEAGLRFLRVDGFVSPAVWENGNPAGYDLLTLPEERPFPFLRMEGRPGYQRVGPFYLIPETLHMAQGIIRAGSLKPLVIVDEVGPLELEGLGVWPALEEVLRRPPRKLVLTIREPLLEAFLAKIPLGPPDIFRVDDRSAVLRILG